MAGARAIGDLSIEVMASFVAVVTIHRPPHNYISRDLTESIGEALAQLDTDPGCRCVLLQAEGKNFCAGARHDPNDAQTLEPDTRDVQGRYDSVARLFANKKPIVAAIQGAVVGAGFGMSMLADFRIAADNARFAANFVKIGFCPGFGLPFTLPRVIGAQRTSFMFQTGRRFRADEVLPWGLVDAVVPLADLPAISMEFAEELASNAPLGMLATRARLREGLAEGVRASLEIDSPEQTRLRHTQDHLEGVIAYRDRRPAMFKGC
jgi:enoyl-CoA hydratase/carnithine racemase